MRTNVRKKQFVGYRNITRPKFPSLTLKHLRHSTGHRSTSSGNAERKLTLGISPGLDALESPGRIKDTPSSRKVRYLKSFFAKSEDRSGAVRPRSITNLYDRNFTPNSPFFPKDLIYLKISDTFQV